MRYWLLLITSGILLLSGVSASAWEISQLTPLYFEAEDIEGATDLSGVALAGSYLAVVSDEGNAIQLLREKEDGVYAVFKKYQWTAGMLQEERLQPQTTEPEASQEKPAELDLEGLAVAAGYLYAVGSHAAKRKQIEPSEQDRKRSKNRKRLEEVTAAEPRRVLFRQKITADGLLEGPTEGLDLWQHIAAQDGILEIFSKIPAKENGVDIEAVAVRDNQVYAGFRGPVLTGNWVPVLVSQFAAGEKEADLLFLQLGGLGIRDMAWTGDGFLLIAGPVGDGPGGYHLYLWDGKDCLPGKKGSRCRLERIMDIPTPEGAKAEGVTVVAKDERMGLKILLLYDGPEGGAPVTFWLKSQVAGAR